VARNFGWLLVVGVIAVGGFFFRDRLTGDAADLRVGDCFDVPAGYQAVEEVAHHPCNEAHTAEVTGLADYPAGGNDPYPSESMLFTFADDLCARSFRDYTGLNPMDDPLLTWGYFYPIEEGWHNGDHEVACYLVRLDDGPMTQSFKRAA
jgi:hypothetical protein